MTDKREFILEGLGCANCAAKMEAQLQKLPGVSRAAIDFGSSTLAIETHDTKVEALHNDIRKIITGIEPDVIVRERDQAGTQEENAKSPFAWERLLPGIAGLLLVSWLDFSFWLELLLYLGSYLLIGGHVLLRAGRNILRGEIFDENFLMAIATVGAFAVGEYSEAVAVMLFYEVGEGLQDLAVGRSRRSIKALLNLRPDYVNLKLGTEIRQIKPEDAQVDDLFIVKPGERIPLDGLVTEGESQADTSALTGESVPRVIRAGDAVLGGFINTSGLITVKATKAYGQSAVARILELVQSAGSRKAATENFITKFAKYYTPGVVIVAAMMAVIPPLFGAGEFSTWLYRALIFLVISCPCALVISIPLTFFGGIGAASKKGVLVKGGNYLEALSQVSTVVFDKTGTLTKGTFKVTSLKPASGFGPQELLEAAALAEYYSAHPIARSIITAAGSVDRENIQSYQEIAGKGVVAQVMGQEILAGNEKLLAEAGLNPDSAAGYGTIVHVAIAGKYAGYLIIADEVKEDSKNTIRNLRNLGVTKTYLLTGDREEIATGLSHELELDGAFAELLPADKLARMEEIYRSKGPGKLVYMGDGINDAPVLARADIGIAMGGLGSDAAIEAADVVIMTDEPSRLATAIRIARRTKGIVWQNIVLALGVKIVVLALGAGGVATMWEAVFADVGVALLAVLNSMRILQGNNE